MGSVTALILLIIGIAFGQGLPQNDLERYEWRYMSGAHGSLLVPDGYEAGTWNYREGIVTRLRYSDSSCIVLQHGGMYRVPMLYESQYVVIKTEERNDRKIRIGSVAGTDFFWREDNLKPYVNKGGKVHALWPMFPPNIAYDRVPKEKVDLYDRALDSFDRSVKK